jgi:gamma-glutamyltranspeptidase/glutathione hydrolase
MLPRYGPGRSDQVAAGDPARESRDTTHLVVFDAKGSCVSLTTTLNEVFGSGWASPRTGILLNNQMDDFDTRPGQPNLYGLVGSGANRVRPGARMLSSMSPCIVSDGGAPWLALGGRGGPRILSALLQVLLYRCVDEMPLAEAIAAPRLHHQWLPDDVQLESGRIWPNLAEGLSRLGYRIGESEQSGKIHGAERIADGSFLGVTDPREHGLARAVRRR